METFKEILNFFEWVLNWYKTEQSGFLSEFLLSLLICFLSGEAFRIFIFSFIKNGNINKAKEKIHRLGSKATFFFLPYVFFILKILKTKSNKMIFSLGDVLMVLFFSISGMLVHDFLIRKFGLKIDKIFLSSKKK